MISIWTDALRIFSIALFVLIMFLAAYHFRNRWLAHRYKDINATSILAEIFAVREFNGRKRGALRLTASGKCLMEVHDVPLTELAEQLRTWISTVDDGAHCCDFHFYVEGEPKTIGLFRIVPRPVGWQFESMRSRTRRTTPVSLSVYTAMAESIIDQITFASIIPLCRAGDGNSPCEH